jgi:hypothetical protein
MATGTLQDFPIEVQTKIKQAMMEGGQEKAEAVIAEFQAQNKAALKAQGVDVDSIVPVVGQHIGWEQIQGQVFRVLEFDGSGAIVGPDAIPKRKISVLPYGKLRVESPILNQPAWLPILHRVDYMLAQSAYDRPTWIGCAELLVTYMPKRKFLGFLPSVAHILHYVIARKKALEEYYDYKDRDHVRYPELEKLFGKLRYTFTSPDQFKVGVLK